MDQPREPGLQLRLPEGRSADRCLDDAALLVLTGNREGEEVPRGRAG